MRVVFLGTPDFAVPTLEMLAGTEELAAVVSQPDRARDRKGNLLPTPAKAAAQRLGIPVFQFSSLKREGVQTLRALKPDLMVTAAFGQILSQEILDIPPLGVFNVHASLLPAYRGAAPIQWAVIRGETETGITVMKTEAGLDCGDILWVKKTPIGPEETSGELFDRLSVLGAQALREALEALKAGKLSPVPQDEALATHFPMLKKEDGRLDFSRPAADLVNLVRGVNPWPSAFTFWAGNLLKVHAARALPGKGRPGEVLAADPNSGLVVACGEGALRLTEVQPANGRKMSDLAFLAGHRPLLGSLLPS